MCKRYFCACQIHTFHRSKIHGELCRRFAVLVRWSCWRNIHYLYIQVVPQNLSNNPKSIEIYTSCHYLYISTKSKASKLNLSNHKKFWRLQCTIYLNFISMHQDICNHLSLSKTRFERINVNLGEREREKIERRNAGTSKERKWGTDLCIADRQTIILAHETLLLSSVLHLILSLLRWVPSFVSWSLHRSPYHPLLYASFLIPQSSTESETGNKKYCNILVSKNGKHATKGIGGSSRYIPW